MIWYRFLLRSIMRAPLRKKTYPCFVASVCKQVRKSLETGMSRRMYRSRYRLCCHHPNIHPDHPFQRSKNNNFSSFRLEKFILFYSLIIFRTSLARLFIHFFHTYFLRNNNTKRICHTLDARIMYTYALYARETVCLTLN